MLNRILTKLYENRQNDPWVFANQYGDRLSPLLDRLKGICRKAGIREATLHSLRHSFGAHLRMAGVSLADIADLMGYKDLATTQIYAKVEQEHLRSVASKLTPLVPMEVSPESVTRRTNPRDGDTKLLIEKGIEEDKIGGEGGIRTPGTVLPVQLLSRQPRSATPAPLPVCGA